MATQFEEERRRIEERARAILRSAASQPIGRGPGAGRPSIPKNAPTPSTWDNLDAILAPIQWDWPNWLPRGFLTILASEPGAGKSLLCLHLAAAYIEGHLWPDGAPFGTEGDASAKGDANHDGTTTSDAITHSAAAGGAVIWCESESSHALNLQRARRWGLDLSHFLSPLASPLRNFNLNDDRHCATLLALARRDDVSIVILDSLRGLTSGSGDRSLGEHLRFLADVARIADKPVLLTHHLRKRVTYDHAGNLTLDQILGASAITQIARVIWAIDLPDPAEPRHRRLATVKNNLALFPDPLGFHVGDDGLRFGPAPEPPGRHAEIDRAIAFLREQLAHDPLPAKEIETLYKDAGFARRTVFRAKRRLAVRSFRPPGESEWHWKLPRKK